MLKIAKDKKKSSQVETYKIKVLNLYTGAKENLEESTGSHLLQISDLKPHSKVDQTLESLPQLNTVFRACDPPAAPGKLFQCLITDKGRDFFFMPNCALLCCHL